LTVVPYQGRSLSLKWQIELSAPVSSDGREEVSADTCEVDVMALVDVAGTVLAAGRGRRTKSIRRCSNNRCPKGILL
jgi:hypothetical protein